jgi:hypothetical protein
MPGKVEIEASFSLTPVPGKVLLSVEINESTTFQEEFNVSKELNNKEATIEGLFACGMIEEFRSRKYRVFRPDGPEGVPQPRWLVGKSGALRYIAAQNSAISDSVSRTDSSSHRAFRYVGRLAQAVRGGIDADKYRDIWSAVRRGEIPVTKDGYHV